MLIKNELGNPSALHRGELNFSAYWVLRPFEWVVGMKTEPWHVTQATEPSPQRSDMGGLNDFDNLKNDELLGLAWFFNSFY